jgi:hypothetical protein
MNAQTRRDRVRTGLHAYVLIYYVYSLLGFNIPHLAAYPPLEFGIDTLGQSICLGLVGISYF